MYPGPSFSSSAFSSLCSFLIRHFQVLQIQRPPPLDEALFNAECAKRLAVAVAIYCTDVTSNDVNSTRKRQSKVDLTTHC